MGCVKSQNGIGDQLEKKSSQGKKKNQQPLVGSNIGAPAEPMQMSIICRPDLGIYDTREWDANYYKHVMQGGPDPGRHPDPDCLWNTNQSLYDDDEY